MNSPRRIGEPSEKLCKLCGLKPIEEFHLYKSSRRDTYYRKSYCVSCERKRGSEWAKQNRGRRRTTAKQVRDKVRLEVLEAYGNVCACCGEANPKFLTIDHVDGHGGEHRRSIRATGGSTLYFWIRKSGFPKDGFQILCWNCNAAKQYYGVCPHKEIKSG